MPTIKRQHIRTARIRVVEISLTDAVIDIVDEDGDPYNVVQQKIAGIVDVLGCSEEEAERIVLAHND